VRNYRFEYAVKKLCRVLEVTRSGYYAWVKAGCPKKGEKDTVFLAMIRQIELENNETYGVVRVHETLNEKKSMPCSRGKVQRIMHENGIKAEIRTKYRPQMTKSDPNDVAFPNLLNQDFNEHKVNRVWLADITYIRVGLQVGLSGGGTGFRDKESGRLGTGRQSHCRAGLYRFAQGSKAVQARQRSYPSQRPRLPVYKQRIPEAA